MKPGMFHQTPRNTLSFDTMKQGHVSPSTPKLIMFRHNETMKLSIVGTFWFGVCWLLTINNLDKRIVLPYYFDSMVSPVQIGWGRIRPYTYPVCVTVCRPRQLHKIAGLTSQVFYRTLQNTLACYSISLYAFYRLLYNTPCRRCTQFFSRESWEGGDNPARDTLKGVE